MTSEERTARKIEVAKSRMGFMNALTGAMIAHNHPTLTDEVFILYFDKHFPGETGEWLIAKKR